jgi:hypothetical protein
MHCDLSLLQRGEGHVRFKSMPLCHALLALAVLIPTSFAQSTIPATPVKSVHAKVNELADLSRAGNADATTELTRQMFLNGGIPSEIPDSFGFTDRIAKAEAAYRNGTQPSIHEADVVKAVNNLANTVGAPTWVRTNQAEVRKVRMRLLVSYPKLFASQEPPDNNGRYKALSENMRPVEASYLAICLLYQKHYNADLQFTDEEQAANAKLDAATVKAKHLERVQLFDSLLRGKTSSVSVRDLLTASVHFFDDLGIEQASNVGAASSTTAQKGAR